MKILITGALGQLGFDTVLEAIKRGHEVIETDIFDAPLKKNYIKCDLTDENSLNKLLKENKPDAVIHCAGWTAVDKAEENKELVYKINAIVPKNISKICKEINSKILFISTDYVFDGKGEKPFEADSPKCGLSTYAKSKCDGEDFVKQENQKYFIVRTSGLFGINGNNFVKTMLNLADSGKKVINVVNDQIVSVTYAKDLAILLLDMIETEKYGTYHAANQGYFSWCDFAKEVFKEANRDVKVNSVTTEEYKSMVPGQTERPKNSRLSQKSLDEAGFKRLPDNHNALKRFLRELDK